MSLSHPSPRSCWESDHVDIPIVKEKPGASASSSRGDNHHMAARTLKPEGTAADNKVDYVLVEFDHNQHAERPLPPWATPPARPSRRVGQPLRVPARFNPGASSGKERELLVRDFEDAIGFEMTLQIEADTKEKDRKESTVAMPPPHDTTSPLRMRSREAPKFRARRDGPVLRVASQFMPPGKATGHLELPVEWAKAVEQEVSCEHGAPGWEKALSKSGEHNEEDQQGPKHTDNERAETQRDQFKRHVEDEDNRASSPDNEGLEVESESAPGLDVGIAETPALDKDLLAKLRLPQLARPFLPKPRAEQLRFGNKSVLGAAAQLPKLIPSQRQNQDLGRAKNLPSDSRGHSAMRARC